MLSGTTNQTDISLTGIPYFKHDFGYEFGVAYPVKTSNGKTADPADSVSIPVAHEFSKTVQNRQTPGMPVVNARRGNVIESGAGEGIPNKTN